MAGPILYSTNPWFATDLSVKYRGGIHVVWCSEFYDPATAPAGSAEARVAPSSSPKGIFDTLWKDCELEERRSELIRRYRKTFRRLATEWFTDGSINHEQRDEIVATVNSTSWLIWRPVLYIIPRAPIEAARRVRNVPHGRRAGYGPELQIVDLRRDEFDTLTTLLR
jgi:hypothetical protein